MLKELILKNRSYRAFDEQKPVTKEDLLALIDLARLAPSAMNRQPLRYRVLTDTAEIDRMLQNCRFATSLGIPLPPAGKKPTGFVLLFSDSEANSPRELMLRDVGIAAQTMLLAATERGFGGCMLASFNPERLALDFDIPSRYRAELAIAFGTPAELCVLTEPKDGSLVYYRDEKGTHYVPKLSLDDILI